MAGSAAQGAFKRARFSLSDIDEVSEFTEGLELVGERLVGGNS